MRAAVPATIHVALGSNRRHGRHGAPAAVIGAAIAALDRGRLRVVARSRIRTTAPLGSVGRSFANAMAAVVTDLPLPALLVLLKSIERSFGRRPGRRWGARVLDLDIVAAGAAVLPSRLRWRHARRGLIVPHRAAAERGFVLDPLVDLAPGWHHPVLHLRASQLRARNRRPKPQVGPSP